MGPARGPYPPWDPRGSPGPAPGLPRARPARGPRPHLRRVRRPCQAVSSAPRPRRSLAEPPPSPASHLIPLALVSARGGAYLRPPSWPGPRPNAAVGGAAPAPARERHADWSAMARLGQSERPARRRALGALRWLGRPGWRPLVASSRTCSAGAGPGGTGRGGTGRRWQRRTRRAEPPPPPPGAWAGDGERGERGRGGAAPGPGNAGGPGGSRTVRPGQDADAGALRAGGALRPGVGERPTPAAFPSSRCSPSVPDVPLPVRFACSLRRCSR